MEILYILLILLVVTRLFGELAVRLGQPALVGELLGGIGLGAFVALSPESFPVMGRVGENEVFVAITDLAMFFLMLLAGLEMSPKELAKTSQSSFLIAAAGMLLPLAAGIGLGLWLLPDSEVLLPQVMFLGTALSITAVPVAVKVLMDLGKLDSKPGKIIVSAAIFDDILSLVLLAVLTGLIRTGEVPGLAQLGVLATQIALFFAITIGVGIFLLPRLSAITYRSVVEEFEFSILVVIALAFAVLAERLQLHFIVGAFVAGLFFTRGSIDSQAFEAVRTKVSGLTAGFLAPIFFASIGLHLDLTAVTSIPLFLVLLIVAAFLCKVAGAGLPARWLGLSRNDSLVVGVGMSARGAVELVIADIALRAGLFSQPVPTPPLVRHLFSAVVIMAVATTLITPVALRYVTSHEEN